MNSTGRPRARARHTLSAEGLTVEVAPWGPEQAYVDRASRSFNRHSSVQKLLRRTRSRTLSVKLLETDVSDRKTSRPRQPSHLRTTTYDYTNNRSIEVTGRLGQRRPVDVAHLSGQPLPSNEEFIAALRILRADRRFGRAIDARRLRPYRPMPPLIEEEQPDGRIDRTIAVGLLPRDRRSRHEIVGVNLVRRTVVQFANFAPHASLAAAETCTPPPDAQQSTTRSAAGRVRVRVRRGNRVLWTFYAIRPADSSGTNGSGVELRYVNYRGKRVLYRAHVPILNVRYDNDACGPYRDWQDEEGISPPRLARF